MHVLIVGGTGLISTAIARQLLAARDRVTLFNRGKTPVRVEGTFDLITGDRTDFPRFEAQMADAGSFDTVIDMVAFRPEEAASAVRAFSGRTAQYVFCSAVDVYTKPARRYPIVEDAERRPDPLFGYAYRKQECEELLLRRRTG